MDDPGSAGTNLHEKNLQSTMNNLAQKKHFQKKMCHKQEKGRTTIGRVLRISGNHKMASLLL